jgi:hypothetical protein
MPGQRQAETCVQQAHPIQYVYRSRPALASTSGDMATAVAPIATTAGTPIASRHESYWTTDCSDLRHKLACGTICDDYQGWCTKGHRCAQQPLVRDRSFTLSVAKPPDNMLLPQTDDYYIATVALCAGSVTSFIVLSKTAGILARSRNAMDGSLRLMTTQRRSKRHDGGMLCLRMTTASSGCAQVGIWNAEQSRMVYAVQRRGRRST